MVRSARSRTAAISTRRAPRSARWSVGWPAATRGTTALPPRTVRTVHVRRTRPRHRRLICLSQASLRSLPLEQVQSSSGELGSVELPQKCFERDDLARGNSPCQHSTQFLSNCLFAIVRPPLWPVKIERGQPSTRQLSEPGNLTGRSERNNLNGLCLRDALQFRGSHWRLVKNHGVAARLPISPRVTLMDLSSS